MKKYKPFFISEKYILSSNDACCMKIIFQEKYIPSTTNQDREMSFFLQLLFLCLLKLLFAHLLGTFDSLSKREFPRMIFRLHWRFHTPCEPFLHNPHFLMPHLLCSNWYYQRFGRIRSRTDAC